MVRPMDPPPPATLRIRLVLAPGVMLGPGKADLLEGIRDVGSIAAAGRRMGMSYKRAWSLVGTMNAGFGAPLVESSRGGRSHGGARLTATGVRVLAHFRALETRAAEAAVPDVAAIDALRAAAPQPQ